MGDYLIQVLAGVTVAALVALATFAGRRRGGKLEEGKSKQFVSVRQNGDGNTVVLGSQVTAYYNQQIRNAPGGAGVGRNWDPFAEALVVGVISALVFVLVIGLFPILILLAYLLAFTVAILGAYLHSATRYEGGENARILNLSALVVIGSVVAAIVALTVLPQRSRGGSSTEKSLLDVSREVGLPTGFSDQGLSVTLSGYIDYFNSSWAVIFEGSPGYYVYVVAVLILVVVLLTSCLGLVLDWLSYVIVGARQANGRAPSPNAVVTRRAGRFLSDNTQGQKVIAVTIVATLVLGAASGFWEYLYVIVSEWASR